VGKDLVAGKRTALVAETLRLANAEEKAALLRVHGKAEMEGDTAAIAAATRALVTSGARRAVEERQNALCDKAEAIAAEIQVTAPARAVLAGVVAALRVARSAEGGA
jgi:geranylgeranyl pyrophosphate synthase